MAKKMSKKPAAKSKKPAKVAKKAAPKKAAKASKPAAKSAAPAGVRPVSTGKGPSAQEVGQQLVTWFNEGKMAECEGLWDKNITSCEGMGVGMEWVGRKAVDAKNADWMSKHTILGGAAEGPYIGSTGFAVKFKMHVKVNASGQEIQMNEVGVYTVKDGKIVREEFMYGM